MSFDDKEIWRMIQWMLMAVVFYSIALLINGEHYSQIQIGCWKAGHITLGSYIGYWIDRSLNRRMTPHATPERLVCRSVIVAASMLAMAFGL